MNEDVKKFIRLVEEREDLNIKVKEDLSKLKKYLDKQWKKTGELKLEEPYYKKARIYYNSTVDKFDLHCSVSPRIKNGEISGYIISANLLHPMWEGDYIYATCFFKNKHKAPGESYGSLPHWYIWLGHELQFYPAITKEPENIGNRVFISLDAIGNQLSRYEKEYKVLEKGHRAD